MTSSATPRHTAPIRVASNLTLKGRGVLWECFWGNRGMFVGTSL
jgi:hypothetical protein